jgi:hypothetical protein
MAFIDDLIKAGAVMNDGIQEARVAEEVTLAHQQMQSYKDQLQQQSIKQDEFRRQTNSLAQQLTANLIKLDADPTRIQQAFAAIAPKQYGSAAEARMAGEADLAQQIEDDEMKAYERKRKFDTNEGIRLHRATTGLDKQMEILSKSKKLQTSMLGNGRYYPKSNMSPKLYEKNTLEFQKVEAKAKPLISAIQNYKTIIGKYGTAEVVDREGSKAIKMAHGDLMNQLRGYTGSGAALSAQEVKWMEDTIGEFGMFTGDETAKTTLDNAVNLIQQKVGAVADTYNLGYVADKDAEAIQGGNLIEVKSQTGTRPSIIQRAPGFKQPSTGTVAPTRKPAIVEPSERELELESLLSDRTTLAKESASQGMKTKDLVKKYQTELADIKLSQQNPEQYNAKMKTEKIAKLNREKLKINTDKFSSLNSRRKRLAEIDAQLAELRKQ